MHFSICRNLMLFFFVLSPLLHACLSNREAIVGMKDNPHYSEDCSACHMAERSLLGAIKKGEAPEEGDALKAKAMRGDLNSVCTKCHAGRGGDHAVGVAPETNKQDLPLDHNGNMTCATTCHNMHPPAGGGKGYVRLSPEELCLSCHDK